MWNWHRAGMDRTHMTGDAGLGSFPCTSLGFTVALMCDKGQVSGEEKGMETTVNHGGISRHGPRWLLGQSNFQGRPLSSPDCETGQIFPFPVFSLLSIYTK